MKPIRLLFFIAAFVSTSSLIISCDDNDDELQDAQLKLSDTICAFTAEGGEQAVGISTSEEAWNAISDNDHFSVDKEGDILYISCGPNMGTTVLSGTVKVTAGNVTIPVKISQGYEVTADKEETLSFLPAGNSYTFPYRSSRYVINISSNTSWEPRLEAQWCEVEVDESNNTIIVTATQNEGNERRNGKLTITYGVKDPRSETITLDQMTLSEDKYCALLGDWKIWSDAWRYNGEDIGGGTYGECVLREEVYNESYIMRNFLIPNSTQRLLYDKLTHTLIMPTGWPIYKAKNEPVWKAYTYYICKVRFTPSVSVLDDEYLDGDISSDNTTITWNGIANGWGLGLVYRANGYYYLHPQLYYVNSNKVEFRKP